jgi:hypothetical protein
VLENAVICISCVDVVGKVPKQEQEGRIPTSIREELSHHMQTGFMPSGLLSVGFRAFYRGE